MASGSFIKGVIIGFSIAAPVGPIGILCIRRTLAYGRASGLVSGLGAATADAMYAAVAGFGLTAVSHFLVSHQLWLRMGGGAVLLLIGVRILFSKPVASDVSHVHHGLVSAYASTLVLTLSNPLTILSYTAVFAGLGLGTDVHGSLSAVELVTGTFFGSSLWWLLLSTGISHLRTGLNNNRLTWINRGAGTIIALLAVMIMVRL